MAFEEHFVGDTEKFAVRWKTQSVTLPHWRHGQFCVWMGAKVFGDWEDEWETLSRVAWWTQPFIDSFKRRTNETLFLQSPLEIYNFTRKRFYSGDIEAQETGDSHKKYFPLFQINDIFLFDGHHILLLNGGGAQRLMWFDFKGSYGDVVLDNHYVEDVLSAFLNIYIREDEDASRREGLPNSLQSVEDAWNQFKSGHVKEQ